MYTYQDAVEGLIDYLGGAASDVAVRDSKRAIQDAYRDLANAHNWTYLYRVGRVVTSAVYVTGTVTYQQSSRQFTLSGGSWPSWANLAFLRVDPVNYGIARVVSGTVVEADPQLNPGADIATPSAFTLYQDTYLLPPDFIAQDQALYERNFGGMLYTHPREWAFESRYRFAQGIPERYTIMSSPSVPDRLCLMVFPFPVEAKTIDFLYKRRPRPMSVYGYSTGTVSASSGSPTMTGAGTTFDSSMAGSSVRLSATPKAPSSHAGSNPPVFETVILTVDSQTSITCADPAPSTLSGVGFTVSDYADIESGSMLTAFVKGCQHQISMTRTLKDKPSARLQYKEALMEAREADSRSFAGRHSGPSRRFRQLPRDMPQGPDEP